MRRLYSPASNKLYSNILTSLILSVVTTIFILSTILYFNFENIGVSLINSSVKDSLIQTSYSAGFMSESSRYLILQAFLDKDISKLLNSSELDAMETNTALQRLDSYRSTTPFVYSMYIYNSNTNQFFISSPTSRVQSEKEFFDKDIINILNNLQDYKLFVPIVRKCPPLNSSVLEGQHVNVYTFIFHGLLNNNGSTSAIILNISEEWMRKTISSMDKSPDNNILIIDPKGKMLISTKIGPMLSDISEKNFAKKILSSNQSSGSFTDGVDGVKSLVTYVSSDILDWKFIRITPYSVVIDKISNIKYLVILVGFCIIIVGFFISLLITRSVYKPIDKVLIQLSSLEKEKLDGFDTLKREFLRNLLKDVTQYDINTIDRKLKHFGSMLEVQGCYGVILLKIDHFKDFSSKYSSQDRALLRFSIANIANEICSQYYKSESFDMEEDHIVVLINIDKSGLTDFRQSITEIAKSIYVSLEKFLAISVSTTVSKIENNFLYISGLYSRTLEASDFRMVYGNGCLIFEDDIEKIDNVEYEYPIEKENLLIDALMLGKINEVQNIFIEIVNNYREYFNSSLNPVFLQLSIAINSAVNTLTKNGNPLIEFNFNYFVKELNTAETIDEVNHLFFKVFNYIITEVEEKKNSKHDDLIKHIIDIINKQYVDVNLSIDLIADSLDMSPIYLGRVFKKKMSVSMSDYINSVRMEKAKELLISTKYSINEIIENTGFVSSSYFYTFFRRVNGVTPSDYRHKAILSSSGPGTE